MKSTQVVACVAMLAAATAAWASPTVYNQPAIPGACSGSCWTSSVASSGNGFQAFDNFTLTQSSLIDGAHWQGFYWDFQNPAANPVSPTTTSWNISIWSDVSNAPGAQLFSQTVGVGSVTATFLGLDTFGGSPVPVYDFSVSLTPFLAQVGTNYWFSPLSIQNTFDPIFSWSPGVGGDGSSWQRQLPGAGGSSKAGDRGFSLTGVAAVAVPEPATLGLLSLGLAGVGFVKRKRKI